MNPKAIGTSAVVLGDRDLADRKRMVSPVVGAGPTSAVWSRRDSGPKVSGRAMRCPSRKSEKVRPIREGARWGIWP